MIVNEIWTWLIQYLYWVLIEYVYKIISYDIILDIVVYLSPDVILWYLVIQWFYIPLCRVTGKKVLLHETWDSTKWLKSHFKSTFFVDPTFWESMETFPREVRQHHKYFPHQECRKSVFYLERRQLATFHEEIMKNELFWNVKNSIK